MAMSNPPSIFAKIRSMPIKREEKLKLEPTIEESIISTNNTQSEPIPTERENHGADNAEYEYPTIHKNTQINIFEIISRRYQSKFLSIKTN